MIEAPKQLYNNSNGGNGNYTSMPRKKKKNAEGSEEFEFVYLNKNDKRMRFNTSRDPIYFVFETLEKQSIKKLAKDFVKDTLFEITNFVSTAVK